jgi:linoleate 8R-lipoxygenase/9,12-octadecadienoate 8-hydroperoxide 8R-isomerase
MEGARLAAQVGLYRDVATPMEVQEGNQGLKLVPGNRLFLNLVLASRDPTVFPDPSQVKLDRPMSAYLHYGWGPHSCLGIDASKIALTTMLKVVAKLDGLRRVKGPQGLAKKVNVTESTGLAGMQGYDTYMTAEWSSYWPFPSTMKVEWDGGI